MAYLKGTALLLVILVVAPRVGRTQNPDPRPQISLFAGTSLSSYNETGSSIPSLVEGGTSLQLQPSRLPFALRSTLAFSQEEPRAGTGHLRYGTISLDAILRSRFTRFGVRPYAIGGLGVATRADYTYVVQRYGMVDGQLMRVYSPADVVVQQRLNWAFVEVGGGVEFGSLFLELRVQQPVATNGVTRAPVSLGYRFSFD